MSVILKFNPYFIHFWIETTEKSEQKTAVHLLLYTATKNSHLQESNEQNHFVTYNHNFHKTTV